MMIQLRTNNLAIIVFSCIQAVLCVVHPDGVSKVSRYQDELGNFKFSYTVSSIDGEHFHRANKDSEGRVIGSYGLTESDGRQRVVDYIADQGGFRAHVRSNEPGLASARSPAVSIEKTGPEIGVSHLDFAASDPLSDTSASFGDRIKETSSRVAYSRPFEEQQYRRRRPVSRTSVVDDDRDVSESVEIRDNQDQTEEIARNSPLTYRGGRRVSLTRDDSEQLDDNRREDDEIQETAADDEISRIYRPPINPFEARRPLVTSRATSIARPLPVYTPQPSTPPYGGFETREPFGPFNPQTGYPVPTQFPRDYRNDAVSMSTIHGGLGSMFPLPQPPLVRGSGIGLPPPQTILPISTGVNGRRVPGNPNLVFRVVAVQNGIQAVPVDPLTGQVQNVPRYPLYDPQNIPTDRWRNVAPTLRPNVDDPRNYGYGFEDIDNPVVRRVPRPIDRELVGRPRIPFDGDNNRLNPIRNEASLSRPTARDMAAVRRIVDSVNRQRGIQRPLPPGSFPRRPSYFSDPRSEYHLHFDDDFPHPNFGPGLSNDGFSSLPRPPNAGPYETDYVRSPVEATARYLNSRGYRSVENTDNKSDRTDVSPSSPVENNENYRSREKAS